MKRYFRTESILDLEDQLRRKRKHKKCKKKHDFCGESVESAECESWNDESSERNTVNEIHIHCNDSNESNESNETNGHHKKHHHCKPKSCECQEGAVVEMGVTTQNGSLIITAAANTTVEEILGQVSVECSENGDVVLLTGSMFLEWGDPSIAQNLLIRKSNRYQDPLQGQIIYSMPLLTTDMNVPFDAKDVLNSRDDDIIYTLTLRKVAGGTASSVEVSNATFTLFQYR
ncbi:hypothetical protein [Aureibacillus halotolerans]|uniref:Uncharacterized protein n=1 Tax=Aureibacillus halotolerans TaxID=1508390 RepID=A0A4R6TYX0_9BACI|nr:hypothetical protein [Aureibacillus halotolerans]TDQ35435.1 hypothetical protein EV213_12153 [Aureibacillus halotolerans]